MNRRSFIRRCSAAVGAVVAAPLIPAPQPLTVRYIAIELAQHVNPLWSGSLPDWDGMSIYRWDTVNR